MILEDIEINEDNIGDSAYRSILANTLTVLNSLTKKDDVSIDDVQKIHSEIVSNYSTYKEIEVVGLERDVSAIEEMKSNLLFILEDIQTKLDNNYFKGDSFKYEDFTPEQLESLKVKGDKFKFEDFTEDERESLKGDKGSIGFSVSYNDGVLTIKEL